MRKKVSSGTLGAAASEAAPNFNPLLRLVFDLKEVDQADRVTISQWAKALNKLHGYFEQNPNELANNGVGKVLDHIRSSGGVAGLTAEHDPIDDDNASRSSAAETDDPGEQNHLASRNLGQIALAEFARHNHGIGTVELYGDAKPSDGGFLAILARRHNGKLVVDATTSETSQIESLAAYAAERDSIFLSPTLRAIVETVRTQLFPSHALPSAADKRETWLTRHFSKTLLVHKGAIYLRSGTATSGFVVTRCVPKVPLFDPKLRLSLEPKDFTRVENWVHDNDTALLSGEQLVVSADKEGRNGADYFVGFAHVLTGQSGILKFRKPAAGNPQDFKREQFVANWEVQLDRAWFEKLATTWATEWFKGLGRYNQILRRHNATLGITIRAKKMVIEFNRHPDKWGSEEIAFLSPIKNYRGAGRASYFSKDVAPVVYQLVHAAVTGSITMLGGARALVFRYTTGIGEFEIAIPRLDADENHRDSTLF